MVANFSIFDNYLIINNLSEVKEFNEKYFLIKLNNSLYEITGTNLVLKEFTNDNKTVKIEGTVTSITIKDKIKKKNKSFLDKLFS